jgi:hypothetical protein
VGAEVAGSLEGMVFGVEKEERIKVRGGNVRR